jgi:putative glycosyltransferase (TIGR04372 family)
MKKYIAKVNRITSEVKEGGFPVFLRKFKTLLIMFLKPVQPVLFRIALILKLDWVDAYFNESSRLLDKYYKSYTGRSQNETNFEEIERGIVYLRKVIQLKPDYFTSYVSLWNILFATNKTKESIQVMQMYLKVQNELSEANQMDQLGIEFIPKEVVCGSFGVMFHLDPYIKAAMLGLRKNRKPILLLTADSRPTNTCALNYWRKYITVVEEPDTIKRLVPFEPYLTAPVNHLVCVNDEALPIDFATSVIQKHWYEEKRKPLLTIKEEHFEKGWEQLQSLGMSKDSWFVTLHIREPGYHEKNDYQSFRNADIHTYLPAVKTIVERGGWVIRMGDSSMTPLPDMEHVIDYANLNIKSDWMDIFCGAQCRFCIGTASAGYAISEVFGVPYIITNVLPPMVWGIISKQDMLLPKLCRYTKQDRYLNFAEIMSPPVSIACSKLQYDTLNIEVIDNSSEDINQGVIEMMERLDDSIEYTEEDEVLQKRFRILAAESFLAYGTKNKIEFNGRIGRSFIKKYCDLLSNDVAKSE